MTRSDIHRAAVTIAMAAVTTALLAGCGPDKSTAAAGGPGPTTTTTAAAADPGSTTAPAGGGNVPDPCAVITQDDAATALGKPSGPGVPGGTAAVPQCVYGDGALMIVLDGTGKDGYDSNHSAMSSGPAGSSQDVSGIGDGAFEVSGGPTALVYFYKGAIQYEIVLQGTRSAPADAAIALARAAAGRL